MLRFEGSIDLVVDGESARLTGVGDEIRVEARRPLHFLAAATAGRRGAGHLRAIAAELARAKVRVTLVHRGRALASAGHEVQTDFAARLLGVEHARLGRAIAALETP